MCDVLSTSPYGQASHRPSATMARGLSREQSVAKNAKNTGPKGNTEDLSAGARAERDAKAMQEKAAAKAAQKAALAASGDAGAAQVAAEDAKKAASKAAARDRQMNSTQVAKQNAKAGVTAAPVRGVKMVIVGEEGSKPAKDPSAPPKPKLTAEEKKKKLAAAAALAGGGLASKKKDKAKGAKDEEEKAGAAGPADEPEGDAEAAAASSKDDALADAMEAKCSVEEPLVPVRMVDPETAARNALRAKEQMARQDAEAKATAKKERAEAHEQVQSDIKAGSIKGLTKADWDLLSSSALVDAAD